MLLCESIRLTSSPLYRCTILPLAQASLGDLGMDGLGCFFLVPRHDKARSHPSNRFVLCRSFGKSVPVPVCICRTLGKSVPAPVYLCRTLGKSVPAPVCFCRSSASLSPLRFAFAEARQVCPRSGFSFEEPNKGSSVIAKYKTIR